MEKYQAVNEGRNASLTDIFNVVKKKLWIIALVSVIVAIVTGLVVMFGVNKKQEKYTASFEIDYPDYKSGINPDGTTFFYQGIISLDTLNAAKAKSESFAGINVEKLVKDEAITIQRSEVMNSKDQIISGRYAYIVSVPANRFPGEKVAKEFLKAVTESALSKVKDKLDALTYNDYVLAAESAASYEGKINLYNSEKSAIISKYNNLISKYTDFYVVEINGVSKSLRELLQDVNNAFPYDKSNELSKELSLNGYTLNKDSSESATILASIKNYLDLHYTNVKKLDMYKDIISSGSNVPDSDKFYTVISEIVNENVGYEQKLDDLYNKLAFLEKITGTTIEIPASYKSNADSIALIAGYDEARASIVYDAEGEAKFSAKLDSIGVALSAEAAKLKEATLYVYENNSNVSEFKFTLEGHKSTSMISIVALLLAFVVATGIVYFVNKNKYFAVKNENAAKEQA